MIEFLVFVVTGFAVSLSVWYLLEALPGGAVRFERGTLREYGILHAAIAYVFAGPVLTLTTAFANDARFAQLCVGFFVSVFWSVVLGMTIVGLVLSF